MPVSAYRYSGAILAQAQSVWGVQKDTNGMLELNIDGLVPGGKEILTLSLQEFNVPGRELNTAELKYVNGTARYITSPNARANITATYRDFPLAGTRRILQQWFNIAYNEANGLMAPMPAIKVTGHMVLFQGDGTGERSAKLEGVVITKEPDTGINFTGAGEILLMPVEFSVDRVLWNTNLLNPVQPTT